LHTLSLFRVKNANFFRQNFRQKNYKIIISVPDPRLHGQRVQPHLRVQGLPRALPQPCQLRLAQKDLLPHKVQRPEACPQVTRSQSYVASVAKIYSAANSMARFILKIINCVCKLTKTIFMIFFAIAGKTFTCTCRIT
jgi:hypothetical protein